MQRNRVAFVADRWPLRGHTLVRENRSICSVSLPMSGSCLVGNARERLLRNTAHFVQWVFRCLGKAAAAAADDGS